MPYKNDYLGKQFVAVTFPRDWDGETVHVYVSDEMNLGQIKALATGVASIEETSVDETNRGPDVSNLIYFSVNQDVQSQKTFLDRCKANPNVLGVSTFSVADATTEYVLFQRKGFSFETAMSDGETYLYGRGRTPVITEQPTKNI